MAELADAADLKSVGYLNREGSSPSLSILNYNLTRGIVMGNSNLIGRIIEDMACYGKSFKVFAIRSEKDSNIFADYVNADQPIHDDYLYTDDEDFEEVMNYYKEGIGKLEGREYECMTLLQLLEYIEK